MLSIRHSIGKTPLLEHMANDSKSVAHFRCYAIAPPPGVYARERLSWEPAFASEITTDVADLTAVVEVVKQDDGEPLPNFPGIATGRRSEIPVEVRRGERVQAGQGLLPHCFGIPL